MSKLVLSGFVHKQDSGSTLVQFYYECMANICYNCGMLGCLLAFWSYKKPHDSSNSNILYKPQIRLELSAYTLVFEGSFLKRVKVPRTNLVDDIFIEELDVAEVDKEEPLEDMLTLALVLSIYCLKETYFSVLNWVLSFAFVMRQIFQCVKFVKEAIE